jgi:hypothetical protein
MNGHVAADPPTKEMNARLCILFAPACRNGDIAATLWHPFSLSAGCKRVSHPAFDPQPFGLSM